MNSPTLGTQVIESLDPRPDPAWRSLGAHLRIWVVMAVGLFVDLWSKDWAFRTLNGTRELIPNVLSFHKSLNSGALMGIGKGMTSLFIVASILALLFVMYIFAHSRRGQYSFHLALGMVMAGALGNLHDRIVGQGFVRDFIKIELAIGSFELWPWIFNVADMLLVCGVGILILNIWCDRRTPRKPDCEQITPAA